MANGSEMQVKDKIPIVLLQGQDVSPLVKAYYEFAHLKQLYRQGWLRRGVPPERCESVAEHTLGVALLAWFLVEVHFPHLDRSRVLSMALLHDFGEIYAGDLIPADQIAADEKHNLEAQSVVEVLGRLPAGAQYVSLWEEFERGESPEAQFVRQVDRLEMALQASVYARQGWIDPAEFFASAGQSLSLPELQDLLVELQRTARF